MVIKAGLISDTVARCEHCNCGSATKVLPNGDKVCVPCAWVAKHKPERVA
jgi:hypothetical protein